MRLNIAPAARCNITCQHCSKGCGPQSADRNELELLLRAIDEAAAVDDGVPLEVSINGGEPFLDPRGLVALIERTAANGGRAAVVTNAYWASSDQRARRLLEPLRDSGLGMLGVSASRHHQEFVPIDRVHRALRIGRELGLRVVLKCALLASDRLKADRPEWIDDGDIADHIELFAVIGPGRPGQTLDAAELIRFPGIPAERCPSDALAIGEDAQVYVCASSTRLMPFHALGTLGQTPMARLHNTSQTAARHRLLRDFGPGLFARYAVMRGEGGRLRDAYGSGCELCTHIAGDSVLTRLADDLCELQQSFGSADPTACDGDGQSTMSARTPTTSKELDHAV